MSNFCQLNSKAGHPLPPLPSESCHKSVNDLESQNLLEQSGSGRQLRKNTNERSVVGLLSCSGTPMPARKRDHTVSTNEKIELLKHDGNHEANQNEIDVKENKNQLQLLMYIVGGREVGQVKSLI
jgi:hypothetical protein